MTRDMLRVDAVPAETREQLKEAAKDLFGKPNASLMVRHLISEHLAKKQAARNAYTLKTDDFVRLEIKLPKSAVEELERRAEGRLSSKTYYLQSVLFEHLGASQMQGDQIEVLRRSNFELSKLGTNLNQIAKALNILIITGDNRRPELGKKIAAIRTEIKTHTRHVLALLESKTKVWETKKRGGAPKNPKRKTN
jgi:Bacterial mobilisation protein (MobC)